MATLSWKLGSPATASSLLRERSTAGTAGPLAGLSSRLTAAVDTSEKRDAAELDRGHTDQNGSDEDEQTGKAKVLRQRGDDALHLFECALGRFRRLPCRLGFARRICHRTSRLETRLCNRLRCPLDVGLRFADSRLRLIELGHGVLGFLRRLGE